MAIASTSHLNPDPTLHSLAQAAATYKRNGEGRSQREYHAGSGNPFGSNVLARLRTSSHSHTPSPFYSSRHLSLDISRPGGLTLMVYV